MLRIAALNDSSSSSDSENETVSTPKIKATKEAQESQALTLYNQALSLQRHGDHKQADDVFRQILRLPWLQEVADPEEGEDLVHPALILKYSIYKNLASMAAQDGDHEAAMESYLQAVAVDSRDVMLWFKMGTTALILENLKLASFAFEQGLQCNANHWPSLDNLCTVLYAIGNYESCLYYISRGLERDSGYVKGLVLRKAIFKEQPSLNEYSKEFFKLCNTDIYTAEIDEADYKEVVDAALKLRQRRLELCKPKPLPVISFQAPLESYSWKSLGKSLVHVYDYIKTQKSPVVLSCRLDVDTLTPSPTVHSEPMDTEMICVDSRSNSNLPAMNSLSEESNDVSSTLRAPAEGGITGVSPLPKTPVSEGNNSNEKELPKTPVAGGYSAGEVMLLPNAPVAEGSASDVPALLHVRTEGGSCITEPPLLKTLAQGVIASGETSTLNSPADETTTVSPEMTRDTAQVVTSELLPVAAMDLESQDTNQVFSQKRGNKRKRENRVFGWDDLGGKRRSARVRNTKKKEDEIIDYHKVLVRFLPSTLLHVKQSEQEVTDTEMKADEPGKDAPTETVVSSDVQNLSEEEDEVKRFIEQHKINSGVLNLMRDFCDYLSKKSNQLWPDGLSNVYVKVYSKLRPHIQHPDYWFRDLSDEFITQAAKSCLLWAELKLDDWLSCKPKSLGPSPLKSPEKAVTLYGVDFPGKYYESDTFYMIGLTDRSDILGEFCFHYTARVLWLRARFQMLQGKMEDAVNSFELLKELLTREENQPAIPLTNCKMDNAISIDMFTIVKDQQCIPFSNAHNNISEQLESLQRCQSLEEVQKLHNKAEYNGVIKLLLQTLSIPSTQGKTLEVTSSLPERNTQLLLLLDAYHHIQDYKQVLVWAERALNEMTITYNSSTIKATEKEELATHISQVLKEIDRSLSTDLTTIKTLPSQHLVRMTSNLLKLIENVLEAHEFITELPLGTMLPWIVLYRLIENEELKMRSILPSEEFESCIPSSLMLLKVAHEFLGRRGWCTSADGSLLTFMVDVIMKQLNSSDHTTQYREELDNAVEQCFCCLYGHPNRKAKAKHLDDHGATSVSLTWERAIPVFEYFKPKAIPEYDSYKSNTVSTELENLLQRIAKVIPVCTDGENTPESVSAYVDGQTNTPPIVANQAELPVVREIYYLLADFYFKNKETKKAIDFYVQDLCCNPERFDSWAGLALARSSKVETRLSSCDMQREGPSFKQTVVSALRCFKRALELDDTSGKLWLEYGGLAYRLHSHTSRQIKQNTQPEDDPGFIKLKSHCVEMLKLASDCYTNASECEEEDYGEEWLQHYMLGKVAEKLKKPPSVYLEHYSKASQCLHEEDAKYPKKIHYVVQPPHLAIESLEMHYRLHSSALKYLLQHHDDLEYDLIKKYLLQSAESPYALAHEKRKERRYSGADGMRHDSGSVYSPSKVDDTTRDVADKSKKFNQSTCQDHNYSRIKAQSPSHSTASTESTKSGPTVSLSSQFTISDIVERVLNSAVSSIDSQAPVTGETPGKTSASVVESRSGNVTIQHIDNVAASTSKSIGSRESSNESGEIVVDGVSSMGQTSASSQESKTAPTTGDSTSDKVFESPEDSGTVSSNLQDTGPSKAAQTSDDAEKVLASENPSGVEGETEVYVTRSEMVTSPVTTSQLIWSISSILSDKGVVPEKDSEAATSSKESATMVGTSPKSQIESKKPEEKAVEGSSDLHLHEGQDSMEGSDSQSSIIGCSQNWCEGDLHIPSQSIDTDTVESASMKGTSPQPQMESREAGQAVEGRSDLHLREVQESMEASDSQSSVIGYSQDWCEGDLHIPGQSLEDDLDVTDSHTLVPGSVVEDPRSEVDAEKIMEDEQPTQEQHLPVDGEQVKATMEKGTEKQVELKETEKNTLTKDTAGETCVEEAGEEDQTMVSDEAEAPSKDDDVRSMEMEVDGASSVEQTNEEGENPNNTKDKSGLEKEGPSAITEQSKPEEVEKVKEDAQTTSENTGQESSSTSTAAISTSPPASQQVSQYEELVKLSIKGLHLTLTRYPHHYKALYRLAHLYASGPHFKDMDKARNLLLGPTDKSWTSYTDYMPCPALFSDRKTHNFFNGVWKIPVEDVDRAGSFASHLYRTVVLLMTVLTELKDGGHLQYLHTFLNKKPDAGRKFLKDTDRVLLAKRAFECCIRAYLASLPEMFDKIPDEEQKLRKLFEMYRLWNYASKEGGMIGIANQLLEDSYKACRKEQVEDEPSVLEQARRYCQQHLTKRNPSTPSQSDGNRSTPGTPSSLMSPPNFYNKTEASSLTLSPQAGSRNTARSSSGLIPLKACSIKIKPIEGTSSPTRAGKYTKSSSGDTQPTKLTKLDFVADEPQSAASKATKRLPEKNLLVSSSFMQESLVSKFISGMSPSTLLSSLGSGLPQAASLPKQADESELGKNILDAQIEAESSSQKKSSAQIGSSSLQTTKGLIPLSTLASRGSSGGQATKQHTTGKGPELKKIKLSTVSTGVAKQSQQSGLSAVNKPTTQPSGITLKQSTSKPQQISLLPLRQINPTTKQAEQKVTSDQGNHPKKYIKLVHMGKLDSSAVPKFGVREGNILSPILKGGVPQSSSVAKLPTTKSANVSASSSTSKTVTVGGKNFNIKPISSSEDSAEESVISVKFPASKSSSSALNVMKATSSSSGKTAPPGVKNYDIKPITSSEDSAEESDAPVQLPVSKSSSASGLVKFSSTSTSKTATSGVKNYYIKPITSSEDSGEESVIVLDSDSSLNLTNEGVGKQMGVTGVMQSKSSVPEVIVLTSSSEED